MVAVIHSSKSVRSVLQYNENKVKQKVAELIHSSGYAKDTECLGFTDKINTLTKRMELNQRTKVNTLHISLNFHPDENLSSDTLKAISDAYMSRIGFGTQPYLVYKHNDSSHPHIHIVTTNIKSDGSRISLHNLGKNHSELARKEIEKAFRLRQTSQTQKAVEDIKKVSIRKVVYGGLNSKGLKHEIGKVLNSVLPVYQYTSLAELNAILMQYNLLADGGTTDSRVYKNKGLVYRTLDAYGRPVGVPIAASSFPSKPTLNYLHSRFQENSAIRGKNKTRITNAIDVVIRSNTIRNFDDLKLSLARENIHLTLRQNADGRVYGLTYIDHKNKCVFNGSDLGKPYSANAMILRIQNSRTTLKNEVTHNDRRITLGPRSKEAVDKRYRPSDWQVFKNVQQILSGLTAEESALTINPDLLNTLKRKKRRKPKL